MTKQRLRYQEAADYLGLSVGTLRAMVHRKTVPHVRLGPRLVLFEADALDAWIVAHRVGVK